MVWLKLLVVWLVQLVTIVLLGALREKLLEPAVGELRAHQIGTIGACLAIMVVIYVFLPWLKPSSHRHALGMGAFWVALAVAFEFGVFHFAVGVPWSKLLADYNLAAGRLLVLLWLTVLAGPLLLFPFRRS